MRTTFAIDQLHNQLVQMQREIRDLKKWRGEVAAGTRLRGGSISGGVGAAQSQPQGSVSLWQNNSGGARAVGDVVVYDGDRLFDVTTTAANPAVIGVVDSTTVASGGEGRIRHEGYQPTVNVVGAVAVGDYLETSTTSTRAQSAGTTRSAGAFAIALEAAAGPGNAQIAAFLLGGSLGLMDNGIAITFGNGATIPSTGELMWFEVPYDLRGWGWTLLGSPSGSLVLDLWKDTYANYPPTVADTVAGSEKPTLSAQTKNQDLALSTWTTDWAQGDIVVVNIDSIATVTRATLALRTRRL